MSETLFQKLNQYKQSKIYPFHMPGHKRRLAPPEAGTIYGMDITEIDGFDNLHEAEGILKDAQQYAADLYHSEETAFVVNGSTAGILAAIAGTCDDGSKIMVARNCHKAVYHAIELHHLEPVYIYPHINTKYGINEGIYPQDVDKMWITPEKIQAIVITSPTYDGIVSNIREICRLAHEKNIPVIVDEAHGAHFNFSDYFPESAVACGADIVIQSTHKTLPAMTQTALVHMNGPLIDRERVRRMLTVYQTSSPSYILMGSIDACMHMLSENGEELYEKYTKRLKWLRNEMHGCRYIRLPECEDFCSDYTYDYDRSKLILSVKNTNMTGRRLYDRLLNQYQLQMEMVSSDYVLAMTSVGDDIEGYRRLADALRQIDRELINENHETSMDRQALPVVIKGLSIYEALRRQKVMCPLDESVGSLAADYIYLYPPGIPLVTPGEVISEEAAGVIRQWLEKGLHVSGIIDMADSQQYMMRVIQ